MKYDTQSVEAPIMNCDDAVAANSVFPIPPVFLQIPIGDVEKGLDSAEFKSSATVSFIFHQTFRSFLANRTS